MRQRIIRCCAGLLFCLVMGAQAHTEGIESEMREISFVTKDGVTIGGSWITPRAPAGQPSKRPTVILLHDLGMSRRDWGIFIPDLIAQGWQVLAIDLRGHGQSKGGASFVGQNAPQAATYLLQSGTQDVAAALAWLKKGKNTDMKKVAIIGVGLGAEIAYFSSGLFPKALVAAVVISPSLAAITEGRFTDYAPRAVLFCAASQDQNGSAMLAAQTLMNFTTDPKRLVVYNSAAHGFALFYRHAELKQEILRWLPR